MDKNFKFKARCVSIVQHINFICEFVYKFSWINTSNGICVKKWYNKLTYNLKMRETWNDTCTSTSVNTKGIKLQKIEIITMITKKISEKYEINQHSINVKTSSIIIERESKVSK